MADHDDERPVSFTHCPKFNSCNLTEDQLNSHINEIAEKAALKALELGKEELVKGIGEMTIEIGKTTLKKLFFAVGATAVLLIAGNMLHNDQFLEYFFKSLGEK